MARTLVIKKAQTMDIKGNLTRDRSFLFVNPSLCAQLTVILLTCLDDADLNDAEILKSVIDDPNSLRKFLK